MGHKNKNKKKSAKLQNSNQRTYLKIEAYFKCSKCSKTWKSAHAWERDEKIFCELCNGKTEVVKVLDEIYLLDNYNCDCGSFWQSIHGERHDNEQCFTCGKYVASSGTQNRFGRHFWFTCTKESCRIEWEDFSTTDTRTQRCSGRPLRPCGARGDIIKISKMTKAVEDAETDSGFGVGGGKHNAEYCDMCRDLQQQNIASRCLRYRKVFCQLDRLEDGIEAERIIGTSTKY